MDGFVGAAERDDDGVGDRLMARIGEDREEGVEPYEDAPVTMPPVPAEQPVQEPARQPEREPVPA